jgi:hypothetical protein
MGIGIGTSYGGKLVLVGYVLQNSIATSKEQWPQLIS